MQSLIEWSQRILLNPIHKSGCTNKKFIQLNKVFGVKEPGVHIHVLRYEVSIDHVWSVLKENLLNSEFGIYSEAPLKRDEKGGG